MDPESECVFCGDAFGIARESYLAYGILNLANMASLDVLDDDVGLDVRAARGIVAQRPFADLEQLDTVSFVVASAFGKLVDHIQSNNLLDACGDATLHVPIEACDDGNLADGDGCPKTCTREDASPDSLADQPDLIKGSDIGLGVQFVKPDHYYFRERIWEDRDWPDDVVAIMERADGIVANEDADDHGLPEG